jgi:DHA2 family multidrug resistance protein
MALSLGAPVMFVVMPIVGQMVARTQARYLIAFGWFATAASMFLSAKTMSLTMSFASASWLRVIQSIPTGFIFIPATPGLTSVFPRGRATLLPA